jgi:hypothetical protein
VARALSLGASLAQRHGLQQRDRVRQEAEWPVPRKGAVVSEHPLATHVGLRSSSAAGTRPTRRSRPRWRSPSSNRRPAISAAAVIALWVPHTGEGALLRLPETRAVAANAQRSSIATGKRVRRSLVARTVRGRACRALRPDFAHLKKAAGSERFR